MPIDQIVRKQTRKLKILNLIFTKNINNYSKIEHLPSLKNSDHDVLKVTIFISSLKSQK